MKMNEFDIFLKTMLCIFRGYQFLNITFFIKFYDHFQTIENKVSAAITYFLLDTRKFFNNTLKN